MNAQAKIVESVNPLDISFFPENGCADLGKILDPQKCSELRSWIDGQRPMDPAIFYKSREEFEQKGRWKNYAPGTKDHNLLLQDGVDLSFIEQNPAFISAVNKLAGSGYNILKKSVIRSTPGHILPDWILDYVKDVGRPNLNPFIRDEFQDVQFFHATDFHQDKTRPDSNFVTVYIYLDDVGADYSALRVLEGSHKIGMTCYPHSLRKSQHLQDGDSYWFYSDTIGHHEKCREIVVTGEKGSIFSFHCITLHGTVLNNSKDPRISLRYLVEAGPDFDGNSLLEEANRKIYGPHSIFPNRCDISPDGSFYRTGSSLLAQQ